MGLKDIFNKGIDAIKNGATAAKEAAKDKKAAMQEFDLLKTKSEHIGPMQIYAQNNDDPQIGREQLILNMCPNVNVEQAKMINSLIPVEETIINVKAAKESKTEKEYIFVVTNVKLWILNQNEYITYEFGAVKNLDIINKGMMSQSVKFNDNAWVITGSEEEIKNLSELLLRADARAITVEAKTKYLCGVTPHKQILNINMKGVTIGDKKQIVLHNTPDNKLVSLNDIAYVQLLMNDSVVLVKGKPGVDQGSMISTPLEARKMSVKVILTMGEYIIETMPTTVLNKSYKREDSTYINNYEYAKKLVDTLAEMVEENRKGAYANTGTLSPTKSAPTQPSSVQNQGTAFQPQVTPSQAPTSGVAANTQANAGTQVSTPQPNVASAPSSAPAPTPQPSIVNPVPTQSSNIPDVSSVFGGTSSQTSQNTSNPNDSSSTGETFNL